MKNFPQLNSPLGFQKDRSMKRVVFEEDDYECLKRIRNKEKGYTLKSYQDDDEEAFLSLWVKDIISQTGNNLFELYQEAISFKNHLALHNNNSSMRFLILSTSVENAIHTFARYQEEFQINLDLPSMSLSDDIMPYSVRSKLFPHPVSVELILTFIHLPEVGTTHLQSDENECDTAEPHPNNPSSSKFVTPGNLVYLHVMKNSSVRPIWASHFPKSSPPTKKEKNILQKFEQTTLDAQVTPGTLFDEEKRSIALDHPIVSDIGNIAVFTFNKACNMNVKMSEHNLHDIEFMECKYKKEGRIYHFYLTIEEIEEGNLGIYEAEVHCESVEYSRSLYKFNLTNRKPFGMKAMAVRYLSCLRSACKTLDDLFKERMTRLKFLCKCLAGDDKCSVFDEMVRLRDLHLETLKGLRTKLYQDAHSLFPPDCGRTTNPGDWHDPSDVYSSGMVPRAKDSTCNGYDYDPYSGWISKQAMELAKERLWRERPWASVLGF